MPGPTTCHTIADDDSLLVTKMITVDQFLDEGDEGYEQLCEGTAINVNNAGFCISAITSTSPD